MCLCVFLSGCTTLPPGEPPPAGEPIIFTLPAVQPPGQDDPTGAGTTAELLPEPATGKDAVSYMLTSLAIRCKPISTPGKDIPEVLNRFTAAHESVNDLQMDLWQRLVRNRMIRPVGDPQSPHSYILAGEIERLSDAIDSNGEIAPWSFLWSMRLVENSPDGAEIWRDSFEFRH